MKNILPTRWSSNLAYAIGLITTDGCLSKDGRHIDFTSKDLEQILNFRKALNLKNKVGIKYNGLRLSSASLAFLEWVKNCLNQYWDISRGFISKPLRHTYNLSYSKADTIKILELVYYNGVKYYLRRKFDYYHNTMGEWRNRYTLTV